MPLRGPIPTPIDSLDGSLTAAMSIPVEFVELADELARFMVADILESSTIEEVRQLIEEMEAKLRS
jgi:hypothetical protein